MHKYLTVSLMVFSINTKPVMMLGWKHPAVYIYEKIAIFCTAVWSVNQLWTAYVVSAVKAINVATWYNMMVYSVVCGRGYQLRFEFNKGRLLQSGKDKATIKLTTSRPSEG